MKRVERGWTQAELAHVAATSQFTVSHVESGKARQLGTQTLLGIADAIDVSTDYLIYGDKP